MVMELSWLDHCLLWITLATTLVYPTVDSGLTITCFLRCTLLSADFVIPESHVTLFPLTDSCVLLSADDVSNTLTRVFLDTAYLVSCYYNFHHLPCNVSVFLLTMLITLISVIYLSFSAVLCDTLLDIMTVWRQRIIYNHIQIIIMCIRNFPFVVVVTLQPYDG